MKKGTAFVRIMFVVLALVLMAGEAFAQSNACVYNQPGGGFAAKMRVCKPDASCGDNANCSGWSGSFPIGKSSCQKLPPTPSPASP